MKTKHLIWIGIGTAAVIGAVWLINRKGTLFFTGASGAAPTPTQAIVPGQQVGNGNQAYTTQANVIVRSSPQTSDGFLIFGGNVNLTIPNAGTWLGTVIAIVPDANGDVNPITTKIYNWYQVTLSQTQATNFSVPAGSIEYVREDFVTVK
jgi:hypothetical protein